MVVKIYKKEAVEVNGPRYKTPDWLHRQFVHMLEKDDKLTPEKWSAISLKGVASSFPDEWADFCVLEGVAVTFL
jgi:hypothetical protein